MTDEVPEAIRQLVDCSGPRAAAFDADGVLWHGDVSEDFTRWMIERGHFDGKIWSGYERVNALDKSAGCLEILRFYAGHALDDLRALVAAFWREAPPRRWIEPVRGVVRELAGHGFATFVVSGTPRVVLDPLVEHLPLQPERVLALELETDGSGRATGRHRGTATCGPGKAERLREATRDPILLAVGNSVLDIEMLQLSERVQWVVDPDDLLRRHASRAGWLIWETSDG